MPAGSQWALFEEEGGLSGRRQCLCQVGKESASHGKAQVTPSSRAFGALINPHSTRVREACARCPGPAGWPRSPLCEPGPAAVAPGAGASRFAASLRPACRRPRSSRPRACTGGGTGVPAQPPASIFWAALRPDSRVRKHHGPRGKRAGGGAEPRKCPRGPRVSGRKAGAGGLQPQTRNGQSNQRPQVPARVPPYQALLQEGGG